MKTWPEFDKEIFVCDGRPLRRLVALESKWSGRRIELE
jgi:hypothetical protein